MADTERPHIASDDYPDGTRVEVLTGRLEGRWGTVIGSTATHVLVSEDGPDDIDDWVPIGDVRALAPWAGPVQAPCYATAKPVDGPGAGDLPGAGLASS